MTGTCSDHHPAIDATSLTANMANYSAIANDFGFEQVFAKQIRMVGKAGDVLVAISSSGNSPNIVLGVEAARAQGLRTIGLSGFSGGALRRSVDVSLHVDVANYGVVEDAHQAVIHVLAQFIASRRDRMA
jgi:phosphoheptose isomerase